MADDHAGLLAGLRKLGRLDGRDTCSQAADAIASLTAERDKLIGAVADHVTVRGEYYERALAAEARAQAAEGAWRPIETAPKDGTSVLLWCPDDLPNIVAGNWFSDPSWSGWQYDDELLTDADPEGPNSPTHWRPLPAPPSKLGEG